MKTAFEIVVVTQHVLHIKSTAGLNPCGNRLRQGGDFPISSFSFGSLEEAEVAARKLEAYLKSTEEPTEVSIREHKDAAKLKQWKEMCEKNGTEKGVKKAGK